MGSDGKQARAIFRMSEEQRKQSFAELSPNKQVDVYIAGATRFEPPIPFQGYLAANWKSVLPVVKERLASESDGRLATLMPILVVISQNYCSLADREDVLSEVSKAIPRMGDHFRASTEEDLREITHPIKKLPPCQ